MGIIYPPYWKKLFWKESSEAKNDVIFHLNISNSLVAKREFQIQSVRVVIGLLRNFQESIKFPFPNCFTSNRASNFFGNFGEISESFLKSEWVGTFLVFSRKFPRKWMSRYVPPKDGSAFLFSPKLYNLLMTEWSRCCFEVAFEFAFSGS